MKFGVEIPGTFEEAVSIDEKNGNSLWQNSIKKEMTNNSRINFKLLEKHGKPPVGYTEITCHLLFEINLDMTRKAWYTEGVHIMDVTTHTTHPSFVSCDTVRIELIMNVLNRLDILAEYIHNSFLKSPTQEKILFYADEEWEDDKKIVVVDIHAIHGLKYSALQFRNNLTENLRNKIGSKYSLANPDLWYKDSTSPDEFEYYLYIIFMCMILLS